MYDWGKFIDYSLYIDSFTLSFKITLLFFKARLDQPGAGKSQTADAGTDGQPWTGGAACAEYNS